MENYQSQNQEWRSCDEWAIEFSQNHEEFAALNEEEGMNQKSCEAIKYFFHHPAAKAAQP